MPSTPISLNHIAYPTWDSAATYRFYTEVLGCEFVAAVQEDKVPSTGEATPFLHTFYALGNGGCIAFFEVDGLEPASADGVPSWLRHLALDVVSIDELTTWKQRFLDHGIQPVGIVDHEGIWQSLYVFDPNGVRIELTVQTRPLDADDRQHGLDALRTWSASRGQQLPQPIA